MSATGLSCIFCNKIFSSKSSVSFHQKTAKFCLKIQDEIEEKKINDKKINDKKNQTKKPSSKSTIKCEFCHDSFTLKSSLNRHYDICKEKKLKTNTIFRLEQELKTSCDKNAYLELELKNKENIIEFQKSQIENNSVKYQKELSNLKDERSILLKQLFELKSTPSITNNTTNTNNYNSTSQSTKISNVTNNVNNKLQLTEEFLTKLRNDISFKDQIFLDEADICRWTLKNGLNNYFAILDKSRKVLTFTDEKGNKVRDQDGVLLANKLYQEFCETIKKEHAQEFLNSLPEDTDEMYLPTTLMRRKRLVQNVINGNEHSVQKLGCSIFKEYPKYEPKKTQQLNSSQPKLIEPPEQSELHFEVKNFSIVRAKIKNLFYKYNFEPLNYGLHTIGGFIYQYLDELEIKASYENEWVEIKDDSNIYQKLDDKQLFELLQNIFTEQDLVQLMLKCTNEEFSKNLITFQKVFISGQIEEIDNLDNIIENIFLGIRAAF
jgi:hypothetical protein